MNKWHVIVYPSKRGAMWAASNPYAIFHTVGEAEELAKKAL
jgi:hypothetical protein